MGQQNRPFENLPEVLQLIKACDEAGFVRSVSQGQFFVTIPDVRLEGCECREYTYPRSDERSQPKGFIRINTKIGPVLEVMAAERFDLDSLKKDGIQS